MLWYAIVMMESIELKSRTIAFKGFFFVCVRRKCINVLLEVEVSCINKEKLNVICRIFISDIRTFLIKYIHIKLGNGCSELHSGLKSTYDNSAMSSLTQK